MAEGFILLHRQLMDSKLWTGETFTRGQAWVDLLMLANHKDGYFRNRGVRVDVPRGSTGYSATALGKRWGWSTNKVLRFLKELEKDEQIGTQKTNVSTLISITNYENFQTIRNADGTQTERRRNKTKNDNNDKQKGSPRNKFSDADLNAAKTMFDLVAEAVPGSREPDFEAWANTLRLMRERDEIELPEIGKVFRWANKDEFWRTNILSPDKLRRQFAKLRAQMNQEASKHEGNQKSGGTALERHLRSVQVRAANGGTIIDGELVD